MIALTAGFLTFHVIEKLAAIHTAHDPSRLTLVLTVTGTALIYFVTRLGR